jgi:hypothetical protein
VYKENTQKESHRLSWVTWQMIGPRECSKNPHRKTAAILMRRTFHAVHEHNKMARNALAGFSIFSFYNV